MSDPSENPPPAPAAYYACPECQEPVEAAYAGPILQCPRCGGQFFRPPDADSSDPEASDSTPKADDDDELSGFRIRQVTAMRRGAVRSRSYCLIGAAACFVLGIKLVLMMARLARGEGGRGRMMTAALMVAEAVLACASALGVIWLGKRAVALSREIRTSALDEPSVPPDFSTLSDGSHHARDLERMTGGEEESRAF